MNILTIQNAVAREKMELVFGKIFELESDKLVSFPPNMKGRELIYPVNYILEKGLFDALTNAARLVGDNAFYLSTLDYSGMEGETTDWVAPLNYGAYYEILSEHNILEENTIYSPQGLWGIHFTDDSMGILVGTEKFTAAFFEHLPVNKREKDLDAYLRSYKQDETKHLIDPDYTFLSKFLMHIYGEEKAKSLIHQYSLRKQE